MKKIYSTILPIVMILCLAMLSSCSGNSDETENGGTDDGILTNVFRSVEQPKTTRNTQA